MAAYSTMGVGESGAMGWGWNEGVGGLQTDKERMSLEI